MSGTRLKLPRDGVRGLSRQGGGGLAGSGTRRRPPSPGAIARRRWMVGAAKRLLPLVALALLTTVALWPELSGDNEQTRLSYRRAQVMPDGGALMDARYHGVDDNGNPYTMTAATARQSGQDRIDLTTPKADMTLDGDGWVMVQASDGVYMQHAGQLDLTGNVTLYRDDGTTLHTDAATMDIKAGVATSAERVHVEGPFGTLDAQGVTVSDRGSVMQFPGPGRLVLNSSAR